MNSSEAGKVAPTAVGAPWHKTCEACGAVFPCSALQGACWCDGVKLSAAELTELSEKFIDCLCPECLNDAKANHSS